MMRFTRSLFGGVTVLTMALAMAPSTQAAAVFYGFSTTATSGPLNGTVAAGTFSYDSSSIVPGGLISALGLLTSLTFTWDGIAYTSATINTGGLIFNGDGSLGQFVIGTHCSTGSCGGAPAGQAFVVLAGTTTGFYRRAGAGEVTGTLSTTFAPVPEPSTLGVVGLGLAGIALAAARRCRA